jgi:hypothetical protein
MKQQLLTGGALNIIEAMSAPKLFGPQYQGESWDNWKAVLKAGFGLPMSEEEKAFFDIVAGGRPLPAKRVRELVICSARRSGKDAVAALVCAHAAMTFKADGRIRAGERPLVLLLAADRSQARNLLRYVRGLFQIPALKALIQRETQDGFELVNGCDIEVGTADFRSSTRGRTILLCVLNEVAFMRSEGSANPDVEVYRAILPAMASLGDQAMFIMISSVHRRSGLLYSKWEKSFGKDDPNTLVITATTRQLNPTIEQRIVDDALAYDPQAAGSEYLSIWRDDLSSYVTLDDVRACVDIGVTVRPPVPGVKYTAFIDASSGRSDSYTAAIASRDGDVGILHNVIEIPAPADPVTATAQVAAVIKSYGISGEVWGDRYAVGFVASELGRYGLTLQHSNKSRSDLYRELLPALRSRRVRLLDHDKAVQQFAALERRALPAGGERIDHPAYGGAKDDICNAIAGALVTLAAPASSAENWLEFYRRELVKFTGADIPPAPGFGFSFGEQQSKQPEPLIRLYMPVGLTGDVPLTGARYSPRFEGGRAYIEVTREHAKELLQYEVWKAANRLAAKEIVV